MLNILRSKAIRALAATVLGPAMLVMMPSQAFAMSPYQYAIQSCWPDRWQTVNGGFGSYEECFDWHRAQMCRALPSNSPYLEQCEF
ncbi:MULTISPECIES: hypothetical protein [unclassified Sphingomonas]|uniref:hypothetical protein n=1 Tax=unclassified Sphingomonas TaxID=196159 RepID=UPI000A7445D2|nr:MULTISPECIES: hypothetical protein [unclassified Sphingomonas]